MTIHLPTGKTTISMNIAPERVIVSNIGKLEGGDGAELVRAAMAAPIGSPSLSQLAVGKRTCTVIISDHTRPVPSRDILPHMLRELRQGNPKIDITLLVATGCHRGTTVDELIAKVGAEIVSREKIVVHDAFDPEKNVQIGILPSGAPLVIDRLAAETELLVAEGFIEPHFFAGFSGGRKSVLPGVCDKVTVYGNHCGAFIAHDKARTGVLDGNPIHRDMEAAAEMAKLQYIVNVVIDEHKRTVAAFAGDFRQAHAAGVEFLRQYCQVAPIPGDVVVNGLATFHGARRRMEFKGELNGAQVYDDYAHHPDELCATIAAVRTMENCKRLVVAFQPHTYTRTKALFHDFVRELRKPDLVVLAEIYAARERNTIGISSKDLVAKVPGSVYCETLQDVTAYLKQIAQPGDVILTVGAGDIYRAGEALFR